MAQFLNTTEINLLLERLIKDAEERLVLISPYIKLNDRIRELLRDKSSQLAEVRIVYGKQELPPNEQQWLAEQNINISFCKNLHAKCYLSEMYCIVTSMNLYDFSQVNNNEMGIGIHRTQDKLLYKAVAEEVNRLIHVSEAIEIAPRIKGSNGKKESVASEAYKKLTTYRLGKAFDKTEEETYKFLIKKGCLEIVNGEYELTERGKARGGEKRRGYDGRSFYFLWDNPKLKK